MGAVLNRTQVCTLDKLLNANLLKIVHAAPNADSSMMCENVGAVMPATNLKEEKYEKCVQRDFVVLRGIE